MAYNHRDKLVRREVELCYRLATPRIVLVYVSFLKLFIRGRLICRNAENYVVAGADYGVTAGYDILLSAFNHNGK